MTPHAPLLFRSGGFTTDLDASGIGASSPSTKHFRGGTAMSGDAIFRRRSGLGQHQTTGFAEVWVETSCS